MLDPNAKWFTFQTFTDREGKPNPDPLAKVFNLARRFTPPCSPYTSRALASGSPLTIPTGTDARRARSSASVRFGRKTMMVMKASFPYPRRS